MADNFEAWTNADSTPLYWDALMAVAEGTALDEETAARRKLVKEQSVPALVQAGNRAWFKLALFWVANGP